MKIKKLIRIIGIFVFMTGWMIMLLSAFYKIGFGTQNQSILISFVIIIIGVAMIAQRRFLPGLAKVAKDITKENCQCCKCTNCGLRHNHWTHD